MPMIIKIFFFASNSKLFYCFLKKKKRKKLEILFFFVKMKLKFEIDVKIDRFRVQVIRSLIRSLVLYTEMLLQLFLLSAVFIFLYYAMRNFLESIKLADLHAKAVFISGCDTGFGYLLAIKCAQNGLPTFAGCLTKNVNFNF